VRRPEYLRPYAIVNTPICKPFLILSQEIRKNAEIFLPEGKTNKPYLLHLINATDYFSFIGSKRLLTTKGRLSGCESNTLGGGNTDNRLPDIFCINKKRLEL